MKMRQDYEPAILPSAGHKFTKATLHTFDRFETIDPSTLKYAEGHGPRGLSPLKAVIYKCTETGAERRWGTE